MNRVPAFPGPAEWWAGASSSTCDGADISAARAKDPGDRLVQRPSLSENNLQPCVWDAHRLGAKKGPGIPPLPTSSICTRVPLSPHPVPHPRLRGESSEQVLWSKPNEPAAAAASPSFPEETHESSAAGAGRGSRGRGSRGGALRGGAQSRGGSSRACAGYPTRGAGMRFAGSPSARLLLPGQSHGGGKFKPCQPRGVL